MCEDRRESSTFECVWERESLADRASSPTLALHGLAHTMFGIRGRVCNGSRSNYGMGFSTILVL